MRPTEFQRSLSSSEPQASCSSSKAFSPNCCPHSTLVVDPALLLKELNRIQSAVAGALYFCFLPCKKKPQLDTHKRTCLSSWVGVSGGKSGWAQWNARRNAKRKYFSKAACYSIYYSRPSSVLVNEKRMKFDKIFGSSICVSITQKSSFLEWRLSSKRCIRDNDYIHWKCSVRDDQLEPLKELVCLMHQPGLNLGNKKPLWELKWEMPVQGRGCPGQGTAEKSEGSEGSSG